MTDRDQYADAMLRERNGAAESRETVPVTEPMPKNKRAEVSAATHDAVPAAIVSTPDENSLHAASELENPGTASRCGEVTGNTQTAPPCVETDGPPSKGEGLSIPDSRTRLSEAEIDALEYVVVEGRIACMDDYGILRSLLVRVRPEWETTHDAAPAAKARTDADRDRADKAATRPGEGTGDTLSPVAGSETDSPQAVASTPEPHATHGEGTSQDRCIIRRLRQANAGWLGTDDEDQYWACHEAAVEIERLRLWGRLTSDEREAIVAGMFAIERQLEGPLRGDLGGYAREQRQAAATLRALLARLG
jgi:hypothetical protein